MAVIYTDCFDPEQIADSGQCFRMIKTGEDTYRNTAGCHTVLVTRQQDGGIRFDCTDEEFASFWKHYFDLDTDYAAFGNLIQKEDAYLSAAFEFGKGIRILNQDPWEMLITFIISQRKNIPAIKQAVETLSKRCGTCIDEGSGLYAFPTPSQLSELTLEELEGLSLGYRAKYIYRTAAMAASGEIDFEAWGKLSDEELRARLLQCYGVGIKVANCVELFGFQRKGAFPVDVWIDRIQKEHYEGRFPAELYPGTAGIMQQYMYYYERNRIVK